MRAWRVVVAIPLGFVAATVLANIVPVFFGVYRIDINQPSGQAAVGVWLAGSFLFPVFLVRHSPSVRETFRRSLPFIGFASVCLDLMAIVLVAAGVQGDPKANDPLSYAFAGLVLLAPVICPVLYYWIVPSENRRLRTRTIRDQSDSGARKLVLTVLVIVGAVAACGLATGRPSLALLGIAGVVVLAVMLISRSWCWLAWAMRAEVAAVCVTDC